MFSYNHFQGIRDFQRFFSNAVSSGAITPPGWNGHDRYPPSLDCWAKVDVPSNHIIMVSFPELDLPPEMEHMECRIADSVEIMKGGNSSSNLVSDVCGQLPPEPEVLVSEIVYIRFKTKGDNRKPGTGFKLLFSFHPSSEKPEKLPEGKWNCSVPSGSELLQHFPCNLRADCAAGEDEADCPYTSPLCPLGQFHYGHSCYLYVKADAIQHSWDKASANCHVHGAELVSFNDFGEWENVTLTLHHHRLAAVYTGLHSASASTPHA